MTTSPHEPLIRDLAAGLEPVRRLRRPMLRALGWLGVVAAIALGLAVFGSAATAALAAIAAFELSLPDAPRAWAWLPLPGALLWVTASGLGCLRVWFLPDTHVAVLGETRDCLIFIVSFSVPLSALL